METLQTIPFSSTALSESDPVSPEEVAAFLDGRLTGNERARLEAYFADNPEARRELIGASRIIATMPPRVRASRLRFAPVIAIAAAAVFLIVLIKPGSSHPPSTIAPVERRGAAEQTRGVDLIAPVDGGELAATPSFVWRPIDGASYTLVVQDAAGRTILQQKTVDTVHAVPAVVLKSVAGRYYWSVDALMPDGSSTTSGKQEFVIKHP